MCGICGYISSRRADLPNMVDLLKHRGPDSSGMFEINGIGIGHTRLSILDLTAAGSQPMTSKSGRYIIAFNGEIYNFTQLKHELSSQGAEFNTHSDTEVILEGFELWKEGIFSQLNGIFAFVIYDNALNKAYFVRDRFGVKPLYYYCKNSDFVFASEINALLGSGIVPQELNYDGVHEYLHYSTTLGENTFYKHVYKLTPGTYIEYDLDTQSQKSYRYHIIENQEETNDSFLVAAEKVSGLLENSVKKQLISDVPVGVFLSGGIDSAVITALASKHYSGKLKTFSAGFDFIKGPNELPAAKLTAEYFETDHHELHIRGDTIIDTIEQLSHYHGQPFGDAANIPLFLMSKELKGQHKVVLQGDGGDELFAGYNQYQRIGYRKYLTVLPGLIEWVVSKTPKSSKYYRKLRSLHAIGNQDRSLISAYMYSQEMPNEMPSRLFIGEWGHELSKTDPYLHYKNTHKLYENMDLLQEILYTDMSIILPDKYLEKVDRATMANGIEARVPFLDNELASYVMSLPSKYKLYNGEKKHLLKFVAKDIIPESILRGKKTGFSVPFQYWLRTSLKDYMVDVISSTKQYSPEVKKMMDLHISGKADYGFILWKLLNLSIWLRNNE